MHKLHKLHLCGFLFHNSGAFRAALVFGAGLAFSRAGLAGLAFSRAGLAGFGEFRGGGGGVFALPISIIRISDLSFFIIRPVVGPCIGRKDLVMMMMLMAMLMVVENMMKNHGALWR